VAPVETQWLAVATAVAAGTVAVWQGVKQYHQPDDETDIAIKHTDQPNDSDRPRFKLYQFRRYRNLESFHPASLKVQAYLRCCATEAGHSIGKYFVTDETGATHVTETKTLPAMLDSRENTWEAGANKIIHYLAQQHHLQSEGLELDLDTKAGLTAVQRADVMAFVALVEDKLYLAMLQHWWVDEQGYEIVSRPAYTSSLPCPLSLYLPWLLRDRQKKRAKGAGMGTAERAKETAKECLAALDARLGARTFFFGDKPSTLDTTVYAYIACIAAAPAQLADNWLQDSVLEHPNLIDFVNRFRERYFKDVVGMGDIPTMEQRKSARPSTDSDTPDGSNKVKDPSPDEIEQQWAGRLWLGAIGVAVGTYVAFMPHWYGS
jgi:glutathione S-transferase